MTFPTLLNPGCDECNDCGEPPCDTPCCSISIPSTPPVSVEGQYTVNWRQYFDECPSTLGVSPIASITINGVSQTITGTEPDGGTAGSFNVNFEDSPDEWCIVVTNECGNSSECCVTVPCCFKVNTLVLESDNFDSTYTRTCTWRSPATGANYTDVEEKVTITGLDGLNGTILLTPDILDGSSHTGFDGGLKGWCHDFDQPIPLGVYGQITYLRTYTSRGPSTDSCGDPWEGYTQKFYREWTGEYALSMADGVQRIVMIVSNHKVTRTKRSTPYFGCRYDPYPACPAGYTEWSEDSANCIHDVTPTEDVLVASLSVPGYEDYGDCGAMSVCTTVTDFCTVNLDPYYEFEHIGCQGGLGTLVRTCNGVIQGSGCDPVGRASQRRVYSVQV